MNELSTWIAAAAVLALVSCNGDGGGGDQTDTDTTPDSIEDTTPEPLEDTLTEVPDDTVVEDATDTMEEEVDPGCVYPGGPYGFSAVGDVLAPSAWPMSIKDPGEIHELEHADLEAFFCDPEVETIVLFFATTWCPYCPDRISNNADFKFHFDEYGAKFVWILTDGSSPMQAQSYFSGNGANFGWYTNDQDNVLGAFTLAHAPLIEGVPWVVAIDADTMELYANNPMSLYTLTKNLAAD